MQRVVSLYLPEFAIERVRRIDQRIGLETGPADARPPEPAQIRS